MPLPPPPSPSHTKLTIQNFPYPILFQINNMSNPNSYKNKNKMKDQNLYKLSFGVNSGSRSSSSWRSVLNFGSEAGSSYGSDFFCSKFTTNGPGIC
jgi:hypothetical protein